MDIKIKLNNREIIAREGDNLSEVLISNGISHPRPCGGRGSCGKCRVLVDGESTLACRYTLSKDITVEMAPEGDMLCESIQSNEEIAGGGDIVLDLGTTTLAMALVDKESKRVSRVVTSPNPQRSCGADIISRIEYCRKNGAKTLTSLICREISKMIRELSVSNADTLHVAGNTTMLHILAGIDPCGMGAAPYSPVFTEEKVIDAESLGINGVKWVRLLPTISAFVGADIVAGIYELGIPTYGYRLLIDLGTNAEIALISSKKIITTSAAAGPCFEGANISCGMSATDGAIYSYDGITAKTINDAPARGICGTGLVDIIAFLLWRGKIDASGMLDEEEFEISPAVSLTQEDVRAFQLAKSAICSAITMLLDRAGVNAEDIDTLYISGGFSAKIDPEKAAYTGLIPTELADKCIPIGNSSLSGAIKAVFEENNLAEIAGNAVYVDLSSDPEFADLFIKNMSFRR